MSVTITTGANPVLVIFSGVFTNNGAGNNVLIIIDIDGTDKTESERVANTETANETYVLSTSWLETLTAGSHTFKIQWRTTGGTAKSSVTRRAMQVIEFR